MENDRILKIGDIFRFEEQEYVFLYIDVNFVYTARIFDEKMTQKVNSLYENRLKRGQLSKSVNDNALYSFVILTTEDFNQRMANFAKTQGDVGFVYPDIIGRVNEVDLEAIKKEIISENSPVATTLKDYIKSL